MFFVAVRLTYIRILRTLANHRRPTNSTNNTNNTKAAKVNHCTDRSRPVSRVEFFERLTTRIHKLFSKGARPFIFIFWCVYTLHLSLSGSMALGFGVLLHCDYGALLVFHVFLILLSQIASNGYVRVLCV